MEIIKFRDNVNNLSVGGASSPDNRSADGGVPTVAKLSSCFGSFPISIGVPVCLIDITGTINS